MWSSRSPGRSRNAALTTLLLCASAGALQIFDRLSFGHLLPLLPEGSADLPNWDVVPSDPYPIINDDRITLTYGWEGNKQAGIWTQLPLESETWMLDLEFRAAGPQHATGGSLQLWLVKERPSWPKDLDNVYTTEGFEGLGVVVDQFGGQGGSVRGFLNDGTVNYRAKSVIDPLAFGHCYYPYRNLGMPSRLSVRQTDFKFEVVVDDHHCFSTDQIKIPTGYFFGVVATTDVEPDEFDIYRFVVNDAQIDVPDLGAIRKMVAKLPKHRDPSDPLPLPRRPPQKKMPKRPKQQHPLDEPLIVNGEAESGKKVDEKRADEGKTDGKKIEEKKPAEQKLAGQPLDKAPGGGPPASPVDNHPNPPGPKPVEDDVYPRPPTFQHEIPPAHAPPSQDVPGAEIDAPTSEGEIGKFLTSKEYLDKVAEVRKGKAPNELRDVDDKQPAVARPDSTEGGESIKAAAEGIKQNSLAGMNQNAADELFGHLTWLGDKLDFLHGEVASIERRLGGGESGPGASGSSNNPIDQLAFMARRIEHIEGIVMQVQSDIEGRDYKGHLDALQDTLRSTQKFIGSDLHDNMASLVHGSAPRLGWFLFVIIGSQLLLAAAYLAYKRKRAKSTHKLL